jgi:pilus assembly protein Flp/PilA
MSFRLGSRDSGQGLVEYALILTLVVVVVIVVLITMGAQVKNLLSNVSVAIGV